MIKSIEEYLEQLKSEMQGSDSATVQDALADAEEHLRAALANLLEKQPDLKEAEALDQIIDPYGSPSETASAYAEVERRILPTFQPAIKSHSILSRFLGVYADSRTWGAILFMIVTFMMGIVCFTWVVTGFSLSAVFSLFIFGMPFALLFLLSIRGLALLEGRLVESFLGVRMPRRKLFEAQRLKWFDRLKALAADKRTWLALLYLLLQLPLGVLYISVILTLFFFSIGSIMVPIVQWAFGFPTYQINGVGYYLPVWQLLFIQLIGFIVLTLSLHLSRGIGQLHGRMAKSMLVTE